MVGAFPKVRDVSNDTQYFFNYGYLGMLYLDKLECPCGTKITSHDSSA